MESFLYAGRNKEARQLLLTDWEPIRRSLYTRKSEIHRAILGYLRGRTALAEWLDSKSPTLRIELNGCISKLLKLGSPWALAFCKLLQAGAADGVSGWAERLSILEGAERLLRDQDLGLLAAAVLRRRGELEGIAGKDRILAADTFMQSEGILRPDRMTSMILPGKWL